MRAVCEFRVVDETGDWIVVEKPAPLAVHPANGKVEPTLLGGLEALLGYDLANGARLSILTRLDRETSGLVLVAKHRAAAAHFSRQLAAQTVEKEYLAIVRGAPAWDERRLEAPILRAGEVGESPIWLRQAVHPDGRPCATAFRVERRFSRDGEDFALVRCFPASGRMHQIRVHLEHLGYPLVGDKIYGTDGRAYLEQFEGRLSEASSEALRLPRHALHACRLTAEWEGSRIEWRSGLPGDLARFVEGAGLDRAHGQA